MARPQLLLVDADPRSVRVLEATLKNEGFSVTAAADGAEALEKLEVGLPDVLITETRLPRLNGFELVNQLRQLPGGAHVPVVFVGLADEPQRLQFGEKSDLVRAAELGVEHCLFKPLLVRELVVRIRLLLARRQQNLIASRSDDLSLERFSGRLQDTGMVDILLSLDSSRRSGCLRVVQ